LQLAAGLEEPVWYRKKLRQHGIVVNWDERRQSIWDQAQASAAGEGGSIPESNKSDLLNEVTDLVEAPAVLLGKFDPSFLTLPE
jgi:glycyl-tRNA synthetase beta subunit